MIHRRPTTPRILLLILLASALLVTPPAHAQQLDFEPLPVDGQFLCPENLVVDLVIDSAVLDLRGFSLVLSYDPAVLNPLSVNAGALVDAATCANLVEWLDPGSNDGTLEVDLALLGCSVGGPGSVLRITFEGLGVGSSSLDCAQAIFRDSLNGEIPVVCTPIDVTYGCPVSADAQSWGTLKSVY